jgi:transglutaminase-like putative cysteine protease
MMLLRITHETALTYSDLISETVMELRMCPRQESCQHRLSFELSIGPAAIVSSYFDWLGNMVHAFTVNSFHRELQINSTSVIETNFPDDDALSAADPWPPRFDDYGTYDYLQFDGPIVHCEKLQTLANSLNLQTGMPIGHAIKRMLTTIHDRFEYQKGVTTAASPITEVLEHRKGVCQDFTHLMIGMARACGIPARYASGFLHGEDKVGGSNYRGATQTHAWCELLIPSRGWVGFDPTNNCVAGENFVKLAVGRHYADVPPHRGLYKGTAKETMSVTVQSQELNSVPTHLAGERVRSLDVPTYGGWRELNLAGKQLAKEMQQQQQQNLLDSALPAEFFIIDES